MNYFFGGGNTVSASGSNNLKRKPCETEEARQPRYQEFSDDESERDEEGPNTGKGAGRLALGKARSIENSPRASPSRHDDTQKKDSSYVPTKKKEGSFNKKRSQ